MGWLGSALGGVIGSVVPGVGTVTGAAGGGFLEDTFFGKKQKSSGGTPASYVDRYSIDPAQAAVANPLSAFLASRIGQGIGEYPGEIPKVDDNITSRYNEFLELDSQALYDKYVADPQTKAFKRDFLPIQSEGYAGSLRGSGRYANEDAQIGLFEEKLAEGRYKAATEIPRLQMELATNYYSMKDAQFKREYETWYKSLPENNPILQRAIEFLSGAKTGLYKDTALDPGTEDSSGDWLKAGAAFLSSPEGENSMSAVGNLLKSILSFLK